MEFLVAIAHVGGHSALVNIIRPLQPDFNPCYGVAGNLNPPDVYPMEIGDPLQNQGNRSGVVLTAESP